MKHEGRSSPKGFVGGEVALSLGLEEMQDSCMLSRRTWHFGLAKLISLHHEGVLSVHMKYIVLPKRKYFIRKL